MTLNDNDRLSAARRLCDVVDPDGNLSIVHDFGIGLADGNYGDSEVWVTGDFWNTDAGKRLGAALERLNVQTLAYDEYERCDDCSKLISTTPGYYGDAGRFAYINADVVCKKCLIDCAETFLEDYYKNSDHAITWLRKNELEAFGYSDAFPGDYDSESGFHPGQDGTPEKMLSRWVAEHPDVDTPDYVFLITDVGQFDIHFRMFIKPESEE